MGSSAGDDSGGKRLKSHQDGANSAVLKHPSIAPQKNKGFGLTRGKETDIRVIATSMQILPAVTRMPLKFGAETLTQVDCVRVRVTVQDARGNVADGLGETPLSVQWAWPSQINYQTRLDSMVAFCNRVLSAWPQYLNSGHPMEIGYDFLNDVLPPLRAEHNLEAELSGTNIEPLPYLAAIVCSSAADIAIHDAYGNLHSIDTYKTYNAKYMNRDLEYFLESSRELASGKEQFSFSGYYPEDFFVKHPPSTLLAWHLVGGVDPIDQSELHENSPDDGFPVVLRDWIRVDGLKCLKVKLRGNDSTWDYDRLVKVGNVALELGVDYLSADFNCLASDTEYVNVILDRLRFDHPSIDSKLLYIEQPFQYDLEKSRLDVSSVSARKPLFLDESAHSWKYVRLGLMLGWNGVALKTCKTQTEALLSLCWAKAHNMAIMVQDLSNPRLAQIPHVRLAAYAGTICGVETNAMQFYPAVSFAEEAIHPGLYRRRNGKIDLSTIGGSGLGYRQHEIEEKLLLMSTSHN